MPPGADLARPSATVGRAIVVALATDWVAWHDRYEDPDSPQSRRLGLIQRHIARVLSDSALGPVRVVSMCAGDGRDLLGVLSRHPRRFDVRARLVELNPDLAARARHAAASAGLSSIEVVTADASDPSVYVDAVPADLVLTCGVFGNIPDQDVRSTIKALPAFTVAGATVVWTRHRRPPDLTPAIRGWFQEAGFSEVAFEVPDGVPNSAIPSSSIGVGAHRYEGSHPIPLPGGRLFKFVD